jgi:hypothetical protein
MPTELGADAAAELAALDPLSDEELTELALAAEPGPPAPDAMPIGVYLGLVGGPLPEWYMPAVTARARRWRLPIVVVVVSAFVLIDALGLCNTFGVLSWA